ncbi:FAD-binding domain-containing protein [Aspergillus insuetus]
MLFAKAFQSATVAGAGACTSLRDSAVGDKVFVYGDIEYFRAKRSYYSVTTSLNSACIVLPESAEDVSTVLTTLTQPDLAETCPFAIRSGGHSMVVGFSDIAAGVTLDLSKLNHTIYHPETETVSLGPGGRWVNVYEELQPDNVMVSGGRFSSVGVGGFLTGGGITIYSAQRGLACDDVVSFDVVLANGTLIQATNTTNPDLFHTLKGGSGNLGVVTNFEVKAFPQTQIWGGYTSYNVSKTPELARTLQNFTSNIENDPKALLVTFWTYDTLTDVNRAANAMYYTDPVEYPEAFSDYYAIENISSTVHTRSIESLVTELEDTTNWFRVLFVTLAFKNDARVIEHGANLYQEYIDTIKANVSGGDWLVIAGFQPMPVLFGTSGQEGGGNIIGLENNGDKIVLLFEAFWERTQDDELFEPLADELIHNLEAYAQSLEQDSDFLYLNYADGWQDPISGYGTDNIEQLRSAAEKYDPNGVFQTQVPGGFKISKVPVAEQK